LLKVLKALEMPKMPKMPKMLPGPHPLLRAALSGTSGAPPSIHHPTMALFLSNSLKHFRCSSQYSRRVKLDPAHAHNHNHHGRTNRSRLRRSTSWTSAPRWGSWPTSPPT
jgi:hypothetical protein